MMAGVETGYLLCGMLSVRLRQVLYAFRQPFTQAIYVSFARAESTAQRRPGGVLKNAVNTEPADAEPVHTARVLVLGGYGNFGRRIVQNLLQRERTHVCIAGRSVSKAQALADALVQGGVDAKRLSVAAIDVTADGLAAHFAAVAPDVVVHTCGPFQGQGYAVPQACIDAGIHYVDLADDTRFVCQIQQLDARAKKAGVLLVSGASSVPGLSSAVMDTFASGFQSIRDIDISIAPGNKAERGLATVQAILSYTGHTITGFRQGTATPVYGWMDARQEDYGDIVGKRWLANVDVPDLQLFPARYDVTDTVRFQAGLELGILHHAMRTMAWVVKRGWVSNWSPYARFIVKMSNLFLAFGTADGAMRVRVAGIGANEQPHTKQWTLYAPDGVGPYIPTLAPTIVTNKLLDGALQQTGAVPCLGLFTLEEFDAWAKPLGIYYSA